MFACVVPHSTFVLHCSILTKRSGHPFLKHSCSVSVIFDKFMHIICPAACRVDFCPILFQRSPCSSFACKVSVLQLRFQLQFQFQLQLQLYTLASFGYVLAMPVPDINADWGAPSTLKEHALQALQFPCHASIIQWLSNCKPA